MKRTAPALVFVFLLNGAAASGQDTTAATTPPAPAPCSAPENRQFDFWIGSWNVENPSGVFVGTNDIAPILGGCALEENWKGSKGLVGKSLNTWDVLDRRWHQTWIDSSGNLLKLSGGLTDGKMVLSGEQPSTDKPGTTVRHRITWTPLEPDKVRQFWETSSDNGTTWEVAFDGLYVRKA